MELRARNILLLVWLRSCFFLLALVAEPAEAFRAGCSWDARRDALRIPKPVLPNSSTNSSAKSLLSPSIIVSPMMRAPTKKDSSSRLGSSTIAARDWQPTPESPRRRPMMPSPPPSFPRSPPPPARGRSVVRSSDEPVDDDDARTRRREREYRERMQDWVDVYTSVEGLRDRFGLNANRIWGDLDPATARRIYQTLLPSALLWLSQTGVRSQDLAPLAYQARKAAKLYIRERSRVPARVGANLFDGLRQFRDYGKFQTQGMTYEQVWQKYRRVILDEHEQRRGGDLSTDDLKEEDVAARICCKILEKSCTTNSYIDELFASSSSAHDRDDDDEDDDGGFGDDLRQISKILEADVHRLLEPIVDMESATSSSSAPAIAFAAAAAPTAAAPGATASDDDDRRQRSTVKRYNMLKRVARVKRKLSLRSKKRNKALPAVHASAS